ncbi:hypothetical protein F5141DRAFT_1296184 [Pisolithus sp. B1]|nr:hypothetical protein F5141DRAFT_1296184 [Pisolithus sp. B1]
MAREFPHGPYHIINWENKNFLGRSPIHAPPIPVILLRSGDSPQEFMVEAINRDDDTHVVLIENTCGESDRVYDFGDEPSEEWTVRYREYQDAYTIEKAGEPLAWTAPPVHEGFPQILLRPLIVESSDPPRFLDSQLFIFDGPVIQSRCEEE